MLIFRVVFVVSVLLVFLVSYVSLGLELQGAAVFIVATLAMAIVLDILAYFLKVYTNYRIMSGFLFASFFLLVGSWAYTYWGGVFLQQEAIRISFFFIVLYSGFLFGYKNYRFTRRIIVMVFKQGTKSSHFTPEERRLAVDTSALIDSRIAGICETGFIDGQILIPNFVLHELQFIADSQDHLRRQKGRLGLETLKKLREIPTVTVSVDDVPVSQLPVDERLVEFAQKKRARLISTDFNLLKVAEIRGVSILNINELSLAMRQTVLPGEILTVTVVKAGKEHRQGVAYLNDGTMVVVEDGISLIGKKLEVRVVSLLQTESGRIIFTSQMR